MTDKKTQESPPLKPSEKPPPPPPPKPDFRLITYLESGSKRVKKTRR